MASRTRATYRNYQTLPIFEKPMCLVSTTKHGVFKVEEEPLRQIRTVDCPLVVVAIAGLYRTGKSYLMNLLAGTTKGFPLGNTIQSKTKGIWAWCKIHPKEPDTVLLLLDTEGLGDVAKGDADHDNKIFTLAALLCNVLVYNMMSAFNEDAVQKLTFISEMSKNIQFKNKSDVGDVDEQLDLILPTFVLCLRDFFLDLEIDGQEITADQYLQTSLELKPGRDSSTEKYNRPRECIMKYFKKRKCFTFDIPGNKRIMKQLETTEERDLSITFLEEMKEFQQYIYSCKSKVLLTSKPVTGLMFATLVDEYVQAIKKGVVPNVDDAMMVVAKLENERLAAESVNEFERNLQQIKLPVLYTKEFEALFQKFQQCSLAKFRAEAMFGSEKFETRAVDDMNKLWSQTKTQNSKLVKIYCGKQLIKMYDTLVGTPLKNNKYMVPGGYTQYKTDLGKLKYRYKSEMEGIDELEVQNVFNIFLEKEAERENEIMMSDQKLTAEDRQREVERLRLENEQERKRQEQLFENRMLEERKRADEHMKKLDAERGEFLKREEKKMELLMESWKSQQEMTANQTKMMKEENEKQRQEFDRMRDEDRKKEERDRQRYERLIEQGNQNAKENIARMQSALDAQLQRETDRNNQIQKQLDEQQRNMASEREIWQEALNTQGQQYADQIEELYNDMDQMEQMNQTETEEESSCIVL